VEYLKLAAFGVFLIGGMWWLGRLMQRSDRNPGGGGSSVDTAADDFGDL
jgi:hypothetical protein